MANNLLITGRSGVGKTTLIEDLVEKLEVPLRGFYTSELSEGEKRAGFNLNVIGGTSKIFSHVNFPGTYRVGKYGVDLQTFEQYALPEIESALEAKSPLIIDEIGKMELLSIRFKRLVLKALNSDVPVLATVMSKPHPFISQLQERDDCEWIILTEANREIVAGEILEKLKIP